jgi:hypothetical protein
MTFSKLDKLAAKYAEDTGAWTQDVAPPEALGTDFSLLKAKLENIRGLATALGQINEKVPQPTGFFSKWFYKRNLKLQLQSVSEIEAHLKKYIGFWQLVINDLKVKGK